MKMAQTFATVERERERERERELYSSEKKCKIFLHSNTLINYFYKKQANQIGFINHIQKADYKQNVYYLK